MPNWVTSRLVISGPVEDLDKIKEQLSTPYETRWNTPFTDEYEIGTQEGTFLLWNIVKPTDLDAYYQVEENKLRANKVSAPAPEKLSTMSEKMENWMEQFQFEIAHGMDWYHWNVREWGCKWEIGDAHVEFTNKGLEYQFQSAWSPPANALDKLAAQYPKINMSLRCHDEGDCFAAELHWNNGERTYEADIPINHYLMEEMYGACYACEDPDDEYYTETREAYQCPTQTKQTRAHDSL